MKAAIKTVHDSCTWYPILRDFMNNPGQTSAYYTEICKTKQSPKGMKRELVLSDHRELIRGGSQGHPLLSIIVYHVTDIMSPLGEERQGPFMSA